MNLAKINPTVKKTFQISPFETKIEEAEYMFILANQYLIGGKQVTFEVRFGVLNLEAKDNADKFKVLMRESVTLTKDEISDWGTDDSVIFEKIATKLGTSVVEIIDGNILHTN